MVSDRGEVWKGGSENAVDRPEEFTRVLVIVEVALVQDQMGSFGLDELQNASEPRAIPGIADEGDFQLAVGGDRARRSLCVPPGGPEAVCQEG